MAKVEGIDQDSIDADIGKRMVTFKAKNGLDIDSALAEYKNDSSHKLGDWTKAKN